MEGPNLERISPHEAKAIVSGDLEASLPPFVRETLLEVVLAWANLDMATAFFVSFVSELNPDEGANKYGRKQIEEKLRRASNTLAAKGDEPLAEKIRKIASEYREKSYFRRRIAHSKCAGVRSSDPNRVIFLPFEHDGPPGTLVMEVFDLTLFHGAVNWAREAHDTLMQHVDNADYFGVNKSRDGA